MSKQLSQIVLFFIITCFFTSLFLNYFALNIFFSIGLAIILQYSLSFVYSNIIDVIAITKAKQIELEKIKQLSYQAVEVTCPCSTNAKQVVPILINRPNYFKCKKCNRTVGVYVNIETAIVTEPIADTDLTFVDKLITEKLNEHTRQH